MIVAFKLSMPGSPSWNGKWSGEGRLYCLTRSFTGKKGEEKAKKLVDDGPYGYHWEDGWSASISAEIVTAPEAAKLRAASMGFASYNWMLESIVLYGRIMDDHQLTEFIRQRSLAIEAASKQERVH